MSTAKNFETLPISEAKAEFYELIATVEFRGTEIILTKHGKPVAKIIPMNKPKRVKVEFGFLKKQVCYSSDDSLGLNAEDWGELHDLEGNVYDKP